MVELGGAPVRHLDQFARAFHLAQLPARRGEDGHRYAAGVLAEAFARLSIALRLTGRERPFAMGPRRGKIADKVAD